MEWSGWLQITILLRSLLGGLVIGLIFDLNCGIIRSIRRKIIIFLLDGAFGVLAAIITFFCALIIIDGQLHPFLLIGTLFGFLIEHYTVGKILSASIFNVCNFFKRLIKKTTTIVDDLSDKIIFHLGKMKLQFSKLGDFENFFKKSKENS